MLFEKIEDAYEYAENKGLKISNYYNVSYGVEVAFAGEYRISNKQLNEKKMRYCIIGAERMCTKLYVADTAKTGAKKEKYTFDRYKAKVYERNLAVEIAKKMRAASKSGCDWQAIEIHI